MAPEGRGSEAGYSLVALVAAVTIMLVLMGAAAPSWRYVMKDAREEELLFRGGQIADAIQRYQAKRASALPPSLEALVQGRFLRKLYKDPMTKSGEWRLVRQGELIAPVMPPGGAPSPSPPPTTLPGPGVTVGTVVGGIIGVASRSTEKSLRFFNGKSRYNEWVFAVGQPRVVGKTTVLGRPPGAPAPSPKAPGGER